MVPSLGSPDLQAGVCGELNALLYARSHLVRAAAAALLDVLDVPCFNLAEPQALEEETSGAQRLDFTGRCAVHPKQIAPINDGARRRRRRSSTRGRCSRRTTRVSASSTGR
jgi:citrate lyase beta subunit